MTADACATGLRVAACQPVIAERDLGANAEHHAAMIRAARARLAVFPELSLTGYRLDADPVLTDDPALTPLVEACRDSGSAALVGAPVREGEREYIATLLIDAQGVRVVARKCWLHGAEHDRFAPGEAPRRITVAGWVVGLAICFDTNVHRHTAAFVAPPVDLYVASVLDTPDDAERVPRSLLTARALHAPVVVARYASPTAGFPATSGRSFILDAAGTELASTGERAGSYAVADLTRPLPR